MNTCATLVSRAAGALLLALLAGIGGAAQGGEPIAGSVPAEAAWKMRFS